MKKNGFYVLLIILMFGFIGCGGDDDPKIYTVTIGELTNANGSTITASPKSGVEGTEIILTIIENNNYLLKTGTLKYGEFSIDENILKFNLPAKNVIITAEFQHLIIGSWLYEYSISGFSYSTIITFFENGIWVWGDAYDGYGYSYKGTWNFQEPNVINLIGTHSISNNVLNPGDINQELDVLTYFSCEILSKTLIEIDWGGHKEIFIFNE